MPVTHVPVSITVATTAYTVLADNSGLIHYMPDLTADAVLTLPAPKAGLWFEFVYVGGAADAHDWQLNTGSNTNFYVGGVAHLTDGTADIEAVYSDGDSNSKLNILTPEAGTKIRIESGNGTTWFVSGQVVGANAPTFADQ